ncbi:MAG: hypothetical protein QXQ57_07220 [Sulfolobales archaeon]
MKRFKLVSMGVISVLLLIALLALLEMGPPSLLLYIYIGSSPANIGMLGTFDFYSQLKARYPATTTIFALEQLRIPEGSNHCLYIVISPELSYSREEAEKISQELGKCVHPALLVADETQGSNVLLEAIGSTTRVTGVIILDPSTYKPYPTAWFNIRGVSEELVLDIASSVSGGESILGMVRRGILYSPQSPIAAVDIPVAVYESIGRFRVITVGDGSIFLNQVLTSNRSQTYLKVLISMIDTLCEDDPACFIIVDGSKYYGLPATSLLENPRAIPPYDLPAYVPAIAASMIHPSTWLPPIARFLNNAVAGMFSIPEIVAIPLLIIIIITYLFIKRAFPSEVDKRLSEQQEIEVFFTADVRRAVASGRYILTKEDFLRLYEIVDTVLKSTIGYGLGDPRVVDVLSKSINRVWAARYVERMNKLRKKIVEHKFLPIVLSWNRTVSKLISDSEDVLRSVGASLEAEKGVEYIVMGMGRV